ncbi:MAG: DUF4118 domain-containing protein [Clostridia bacterium]|nr:DUF4118 domain-containing protein [Clostridia bacterium]
MINSVAERDKSIVHILVCISASPSNEKIIKAAASMAKAYSGSFTAIYVQTPKAEKMRAADKERLTAHIRLAGKLGATVSTIYGEDIPYQIAEFSRASRVTDIVIGRSGMMTKHALRKQALTEKLVAIAPELNMHIIPDMDNENRAHVRKISLPVPVLPSLKDMGATLAVLAVTTGISYLFDLLGFTKSNIITVYILSVLLTSLLTKSYICSIVASISSVLLFNFLFTEPKLTLHAYDTGYPVTFAVMLISSLITGTLANKLKSHAKQSAQAAFRTKVLFDTNQLLQKADTDDDIFKITANQIMKLLNRDVIVYPEKNGELKKEYLFTVSGGLKNQSVFFSHREKRIAKWVFDNHRRAGATTDKFSASEGLYLSIRMNHRVFGVVGIHIGNKPLEPFESNVLLSILGECALAIENSRNNAEKEQSKLVAKNEQLRANLLRTISHDLRTPLTAISGNTQNLLANLDTIDKAEVKRMLGDIEDDAIWLIDLVENLLSVTRIDDGQMRIHTSMHLVDEVIEESLRHIDRRSEEHCIKTIVKNELLLVKIDARLISQVIVNIVNNAIKYTPKGSTITISAEKEDKNVKISIADNGHGIPDEHKNDVFKMFYTGNNQVADNRRSLGLGLSLCKSILLAHGSEISLKDNAPSGCIFSFQLPICEVNLNA